MNLLEVENLWVQLNGGNIIKGVSLHIGEGEFVGLIGPNGAGKSTLLKALFGLVRRSGMVSFAGQDSSTMQSSQRAQVASYLPQERDIHWPVDVERLVGLGRSQMRASFAPPSEQDQRAIETAMEQMDIADLRKRPATTLSGGERARVLIARVLAQETPLILADEPTSGLDPSHQIALMSCFSSLAAGRRSVVCCLHDLSLAARWCHRIIVIDNGRITADGTPSEVLTAEMMRTVYGVNAYVSEFQSELVFLPWNLSQDTEGDGNER